MLAAKKEKMEQQKAAKESLTQKRSSSKFKGIQSKVSSFRQPSPSVKGLGSGEQTKSSSSIGLGSTMQRPKTAQSPKSNQF